MVNNKSMQTQFHSFDGLPRPFSDIDGFRLTDKYAIFLEGKHIRNAKLQNGQISMLKRFCDSLPIPAMLIVYVHGVDDVTKDVNVAECPVTEIYFDGVWFRDNVTVGDIVQRFIQKNG